MALSPKERKKIIEEEKLRFETRQSLQAEACARHPRRGRWLWWLALILLACAAYNWFSCGGAFCGHRMGMGPMGAWHGQMPPHCMQHGPMGPDDASGVKPGQPIPDKR